jgi:tRNA 2-selenouridine synthase
VFVEAESRKHRPRAAARRATAQGDPFGAPGLRIEASTTGGPRRLPAAHDYDYAVADPAWLVERLGHLRGLQSNETLARWQTLIAAGAFPVLVAELLTQHYDPLYQRSQAHNYDSFGAATRYTTEKLDAASLDRLAAEILSASA